MKVAGRVRTLLLCAVSSAAGCFAGSQASLASAKTGSVTSLYAARLGVVVNDADPYSVAVAEYYVARRSIPPQNVVHVNVPVRPTLTVAEFDALKQQVVAQTPTSVQAFALTWVQPYRVDCMSITSAIALGYDPSYCATGCFKTRKSAYFNSTTRLPANTFGLFPTMSIAAYDVQQAKALIDRGVASDGTRPTGTAYLVSSSDAARNVRAVGYRDTFSLHRPVTPVRIVYDDDISNRLDVMFYFIGARAVDNIKSNRFLPGAVADHLTSTGGDLLHTRQMSSLRWIEGGATGTYGSVVEPCAFVEKFPDPVVFMRFYLAGETLIEAYWKSVAMPGQGIFVGEPLAQPFAK
jgi:uncharacterized protein (TIGR03790 family)